MRGKTNRTMRRLTATTMTSGKAASAMGGRCRGPPMDGFRGIERAGGRGGLAHHEILSRVVLRDVVR